MRPGRARSGQVGEEWLEEPRGFAAQSPEGGGDSRLALRRQADEAPCQARA